MSKTWVNEFGITLSLDAALGWITIGGYPDGDEKHVEGTHVFVGKGGRIEKGPSGLVGKKLRLSKGNKTNGNKKSSVSAQSSPAPTQQQSGFNPTWSKTKETPSQQDDFKSTFKKFFSGANASKVVDQNGKPQQTHQMSNVPDNSGKPIIVYHGTTVDFDKFDKSMTNPKGHFGPGFYFTTDQKEAEKYHKSGKHGGTAGKIHTAYINIRKPFEDEPGKGIQLDQLPDDMRKRAEQLFPGENSLGYDELWKTTIDGGRTYTDTDGKGKARVNDLLQKLGYDGFKVDRGNGHNWWISFEPDQILLANSDEEKNMTLSLSVEQWAAQVTRACLAVAGDDVEAGFRAAEYIVSNLPTLGGMLLSTDAQGHEHRGKGEGGGQFVKKGRPDSPTPLPANTFEKKGASHGRMMQALRIGSGKDAKVVLRNGKPAPDHITPGMIPLDWSDVQVSLDPDADLLVKAFDNKGRGKSVYSDKLELRNAAIKFARVDEMIRQGATIDREIQQARNNPKTKEQAECAWLMSMQATRPGSKSDTGAKVKAYGATTLQGRHVLVDEKGNVSLKFIGKEGVLHQHQIRDAKLAAMLKERKQKSGDDGDLFNCSESSVDTFIGKLDGGHFSAKDFRTRRANLIAVKAIAKFDGAPKDDKEYKRRVKAVAYQVSTVLGNKPQQCLESYINPAVFSVWQGVTK